MTFRPLSTSLTRTRNGFDKCEIPRFRHTGVALARRGCTRGPAARQIITDRLDAHPAPRLDDQIVATYFLALRIVKLDYAAKEISYHATTGLKTFLAAPCWSNARKAVVLFRSMPPAAWPGAHGFIRSRCAATDAISLRRYSAYRRGRHSVRYLRESGCPPLLCRFLKRC